MPPIKVLYLIRHGHYDSADPREPTIGKALLPVGSQQASFTAERFAKLIPQVDRILCSDYLRAQQTAEIIQAKLPETPLEIDVNLREIKVSYYLKGKLSIHHKLEADGLRTHP